MKESLQKCIKAVKKKNEHVNELKWNISKLLQHNNIGSNAKLELLLIDVYQAALQSCEIVSDQEPPKYLPTHFASIRRFLRTSSIDLCHEGRFRIFDECSDSSKTSLPPNVLFSMDHPIRFIHQKLSYRSDLTKNVGMLCDSTETVVCCDDQSLEFVSRVLDNMPFAQLHMGSFPDCHVELDLGTIRSLESLGVLLEGSLISETTTTCKIRSEDLNAIRSILSFSQHKSSIQQTLVKLIDVAVDSVRKRLLGTSNEPHLVLLAHSINASLVASALETWKQQKLGNKSMKRQHIEDLLNQAVTVVTFSSVCKRFSDGPAYIHLSMYDDHLNRIHGVTDSNPDGGGRGAVYLHTWSPFEEGNVKATSMKDHDAHNMNACSLQYLYLIMRINGITSFRDLYRAARYVDPRSILDINPSNFAIDYTKHKIGELVIPPTIDRDLLPSMIRATGGDRWLWNPMQQGGSDFEDLLPDSEEAKVYLEEFFGYSAYEEICEICCNNIISKQR